VIIDSTQMILRRGVRVITNFMYRQRKYPYQTCKLISVEFRPYPAPEALVVQYRVALWGQRRGLRSGDF